MQGLVEQSLLRKFGGVCLEDLALLPTRRSGHAILELGMDLNTVLAEVHRWSVEDRLRLIEGIREGLANENSGPDLSEELKQLLDLRLADLEANPENVVSWEEIKAHVRRPR